MPRAYIYNKVYVLLAALSVSVAALAAHGNHASVPAAGLAWLADSVAQSAVQDTTEIAPEPQRRPETPPMRQPQTESMKQPDPKGRTEPAAEAATAQLDSLAEAAIASLRPKTFKPDPIRSQWVAMVLPGGGQIYNHKYWKLPIIYGGFLGCAYALSWNSQMLRDYSQAYLDIMDSDPDTKSYEKMLPLGYDISGREDRFKEIFKNKKNYYRKYRDMSILAFALVYVIGVIDAYVDAELSTFDISSDLSLHMNPAIFDTNPARTTTGIGNGTNIGLAMTLDF